MRARAVTSEEVDHYRRHGWVVLRGYVSAADAARVLELCRSSMGEEAERPMPSVFRDGITMWRRWDDPWRTHPELLGLGRSADYAGPLTALAGGALRYLNDQVAVKVPPGASADPEGGVPMTDDTPWHQDHPYLPIDRIGDLTAWLALHDMDAEHGTLRFLDGSHEVGGLEASLLQEDLRETHASLWDRFPVSEPFALQAGDVTVHHGCTIHWAPANTRPTLRWAYIAEFIPADARVARLPNVRAAAAGLGEGDEFDHEAFPLVPLATARS